MAELLVVSPHLDDAVLSCGQMLANPVITSKTVVTVFAGNPGLGIATEFDTKSGWATSQDAVIGRITEDRAALKILGAVAQRWLFLDGQYDVRIDVDALVKAFTERLRRRRPSWVCVPLGLLHPDHLVVADAATHVFAGEVPVWWYEELPARVLFPTLVPARIAEIEERVGRRLVEEAPYGPGSLMAKERAVGCYRSQRWALEPLHPVFCPERYWRAER